MARETEPRLSWRSPSIENLQYSEITQFQVVNRRFFAIPAKPDKDLRRRWYSTGLLGPRTSSDVLPVLPQNLPAQPRCPTAKRGHQAYESRRIKGVILHDHGGRKEVETPAARPKGWVRAADVWRG